MLKSFLILLLMFSLLSSCAKKEVSSITSESTEEEKAIEIYYDAVNALNTGDAFYAGKKFREVENLMPQSEWASKASLMASYADYSRNSYAASIFSLQRHIKNYPADKNLAYAHYLIAMCYYEQILDEKKDLKPLLRTKEKINFYLKTFPNSDYALDLEFKLDLVNNQLAAKELYVAKYYISTQKWIAAINRLKVITKDYDQTIFVEEALHRLVEIYYKIGLVEEAKEIAILLGYNYNSSEWYQMSYKVLNKEYKIPKKSDLKNNEGLIKRTIKKILN